jgi:glycosyltransferase involved in cell wall biosynthesis
VLEFKGEVQDMSSAYQQADILVLTSDYEGTPNVILEAMASGLAVVATGVGGVPEIVQHGETGFVVPCGRDEMIVEAILRLTSDEALRLELGHRARRYVEVNHSLERLPEYLEKLYEKVFS